MTDWTYGGFAEEYDMDGIISIGGGKLMVHDIMDPTPDIMRGDVLFCDPPCSQGNLQAFATKSGKGSLPKSEYYRFESRLREVIIKSGAKAVYIEAFLSNMWSWASWLAEVFGERNVHVSDSCYYHKKDNKCWIISAFRDGVEGMPRVLPYQDEEDDIRDVCKAAAACGLSVCDPCAGRGLVPYWASRFGAPFAATELNRHRLAYAVARIDQGTLKPKRRK